MQGNNSLRSRNLDELFFSVYSCLLLISLPLDADIDFIVLKGYITYIVTAVHYHSRLTPNQLMAEHVYSTYFACCLLTSRVGIPAIDNTTKLKIQCSYVYSYLCNHIAMWLV